MLHRDEQKLPKSEDSSVEMSDLTARVAKWGMETGFLGLEHSVEPMLTSLVHEAARRLFGSSETELSRLRSELDTLEAEWEQTAHRVAAYRSRFGELVKSYGWLTGFRAWFWDFREFRAARRLCRQREPEMKSIRSGFATAERVAKAAKEWCEIASQALRAQYDFEKARAAALRPETR